MKFSVVGSICCLVALALFAGFIIDLNHDLKALFATEDKLVKSWDDQTTETLSFNDDLKALVSHERSNSKIFDSKF